MAGYSRRSLLWLLSSLLPSLTAGAQPSAPSPVAAPMRPLTWGQLNFLQTTDTHGWHAGHLQEPQYSADWGDYISFANRMREKADKEGRDLLLIDTGDRIEGNGLYDASNPKGQYTYDIFGQQDIDIICTGNHELYQADAAAREYTNTVPNFPGKYIASNLDYINPKTGEQIPMAQRYRKFTTKNQGIRVVAFGFLFDFSGNANNTVVQPVEKTIQEQWFQDAIREDTDMFIVIGHVTLHGPEYKALYKAIRGQNWDTPIQFFGGHSHIRDVAKYDANSYGLQAGRYMETIGWASLDGIRIKGKQEFEKISESAGLSFTRRYIDNNLLGYYYHTGLDESSFPTEHGTNVSASIRDARKTLELDHNYGCAPKDFWLNRAPFPSNDSLFTWLQDSVLPELVHLPERKGVPRIALTNTGAMRFDIFKGAFTRDTTYIVSPFISKFVYIKDVPYVSASQLLRLINNGGPVFEAAGLQKSQLTSPEHISIKSDIIPEPEVYNPGPQSPLGDLSTPDLVPGYTTKDELGDDGDDTVHSPLTFYRVPNCIESRIEFPEKTPEKVDLVFIDFITPWVLAALTFTGEKYTKGDVLPYLKDGFTELLAEWIKQNWGQDC
ncbi:metallo-dependent phosphatase-1 [Coleophoma crateriformis]|uniref:Metallo-dependent phosphatase-1 n=1 Tax=Coleophoma crateriformis TaxID=565419 RepID=A0A3D8QYE6_9HELO|nr:metallo-dependent phosphatase-1 [Coleophoma crateriformis]